MHNPAWRPAQLHTERLASIQHHFFDERPAAPGAGKPGITHILPVHMAVVAGHPADALQPDHLVESLTRQLNRLTSTDRQQSVWQLETRPMGRRATNADQGFILVFATADLEGVRLAYAGIKMLSATPSRRFGVLFSGAPDDEYAHRCQERLASGARRFLGIHLHDLGHASAPVPDASAELASLAGEVQRLWQTYSMHNQPEIIHT